MSESPQLVPHTREQVDPRSTSFSGSLASGGLLARNATLNLFTEGILFAVLLTSFPILVSRLGTSAFGLFSLAWVLIGYLSLFDIGVSRAATKFISEHLALEDVASVRMVTRTALLATFLLGIVGSLTAIAASPLLLKYAFKVPAAMQADARLVLISVIVAVPILLLQGTLRGTLSSFQRFGRMNLVNAIGTCFQWSIACWLAWRGNGVGVVVASTVVVRLLIMTVYAVMVHRCLHGFEWGAGIKIPELINLLRFGGWVTVSQLISPVLVYVDRIFIASFVSLAAVTFYTIPYEAIFRLRIVPASLTATTYPAFSERAAVGDVEGVARLYEGSLRYMVVLLVPGILFLTVLGQDLLTLWMGQAFAQESSIVLQLLAFGVLANCLATIPYYSIQALGKPELTAKFHLLELPIYLGLCFALIPRWGIVGAAVATTVRVTLDAVLLFWAANRYQGCSYKGVLQRRWLPVLLCSAALLLGLVGIKASFSSVWIRVAVGGMATGAYLLTTFMMFVDRPGRSAFTQLFPFGSKA